MPTRPTRHATMAWVTAIWNRHAVLRWVTAITGGLALSAVVLWMLPSWLTQHPHVEGAEQHTAITATRLGIIAYLVAAGAAVTLAYTARTYRLTHTGQVTDRYTKAIGQLGDRAARDVRIGAIYALERIAKDSPDDQPTILEVLTAYLPGTRPDPTSGGRHGQGAYPGR